MARRQHLSRKITRILVVPEIGSVRNFDNPELEGLRMWRIPKFANYLIFYRPTSERVEIVRVLHGARDIPSLSSSKFLSQALGYDGVVEAEALFSHVSQPYEQGFERQGVQIQLATATAWCSEPMPVHSDPGIAQQKCDTNKKKP